MWRSGIRRYWALQWKNISLHWIQTASSFHLPHRRKQQKRGNDDAFKQKIRNVSGSEQQQVHAVRRKWRSSTWRMVWSVYQWKGVSIPPCQHFKQNCQANRAWTKWLSPLEIKWCHYQSECSCWNWSVNSLFAQNWFKC